MSILSQPSPAYLPAATASPALTLTPANAGSPTKESYFLYGPPTPPPPFDAVAPLPTKRSRKSWPSLRRLDWHAAQTVWWAAVPLVLYAIAIALALAVLFSTNVSFPFMSVVQQSGTGRLDYYVLNSCATAPGSETRHCQPPAIFADFIPSLTRISSYLPGLASVKLPFYSHQTTAIFVSSTVLLGASFLIYLTLWTLVYFPRTRVLPALYVRFARYYSRRLFDVVGALIFVSFVLHVTIGLGYQLYLIGFRDDFTRWLQFGAYSLGSKDVDWVAHLGKGFNLVWVGCTCEALLVIAIKVSLHNGLDERVEWPDGDSKEQY